MGRIAVSEYFYSLQGEGRTMGIPAIFLRLTGCNLICGGAGAEKDGQLHDGATWICDTMEVWMRGETLSFEALMRRLEAIQFVERLRAGVHLVITGGEPLLQQKRIIAFLEFLEREYALRPIIEIETNATIRPLDALDARVHYWNTSPKLANAGMPMHKRVKKEVLHWFKENTKTMAKFVVGSPSDYDEIKRQFLDTGYLDKKQLVLMPSADSIEELLATNKIVAALCIEHQVRMCTRMHVEIWNQLTGV